MVTDSLKFKNILIIRREESNRGKGKIGETKEENVTFQSPKCKENRYLIHDSPGLTPYQTGQAPESSVLLDSRFRGNDALCRGKFLCV